MSRKEPPTDAPEGTVWFGGAIDWISVRLLIRSEAVIPADVTRLLGVEPTNSHIPNTPFVRPNGSIGPVRREGFWSLTVRQTNAGEISFADAAVQMLARLPVDHSTWLSLPAQPTLIFSLGMPRPNCGFNIDPSLARMALERNILLGFDIYGESLWSEE